jgi:adenine deaminase
MVPIKDDIIKNDLIAAARGDRPVDLLLTNLRLVNVFNGRIENTAVALAEGFVVGFGDTYAAKRTLDLGGRYLLPGFIDSHLHIESAMTGITEFCRAVLPHGTTTVVADPHEIANVLGTVGIEYMLASAEDQPLDVRFSLPSCVPATEMETAGARLEAEDLEPFFGHPRIVALAEMMNFPGVIFADPTVLAKITASHKARRPVDGHAPGLSGPQLAAYLSAGIGSDHECTDLKEAAEKLAAGMHIMVREGTCARNLDDLFGLIDTHTARRMMWCTDDRHPHDLLDEGHVDAIVRKAIGKGLDPVTAIQMATLNPATYFRLDRVGAVAPGRRANLLVVSDLDALTIDAVYVGGREVAAGGGLTKDLPRPAPISVPPSMKVDLDSIDLAIPAAGERVRIIEVIPDQVVTRETRAAPTVIDGQVVADTQRDLLKLAVVERHTGSGNVGLGLATGFGLRKGALAASVAHDSHNLIAIGASDADMHAALGAVVALGGGFAAVVNGQVKATVPLPIAGLMSDAPMETVRHQLDTIIHVAHDLGSPLSDPFMALGFIALPVIPKLKITDKGLVDVERFEVVPLFCPA